MRAMRFLKRLALAGTLALQAMASATLAGEGNLGNPSILPPQSHAYGHTYGEWSEAWFQWCFSLPVTHNPIFDTADISAGQNGPVWFLGGNFTGTPVTRTGTVPAGTALFFPILNNWADNTDCSGGQMISDNNTEAFLRSFVAGQANQAQNVSCTIDGVAVSGLTDAVNTPDRAPSATPGGFSYTVPATDSVLSFLGLTCWSDNTGTPLPVDAAVYHPVADGVYLLVKPLPPGNHTIHCHGNVGTFIEDFTYHITVLR